MTGTCVEKIAHEACGSSDALQVYEHEGIYTAFCFSCGKYEPSPYGEGGKPSHKVKLSASKEETAALLKEIGDYPTADMTARGLRNKSAAHFDVVHSVDPVHGEPRLRYFPYTSDGKVIGYKVKMISEKRMWWVGTSKEADLFGWAEAIGSGSKTLFITEGEEDAIALRQALKDKQAGTKWADLEPAVCSLINGASSVDKDLGRLARKINLHFKEVTFVFDMDDAGREAAEAGRKIFPQAKTVALPNKDANEAVMKGHSKALANAVLFKQEEVKNTRIIMARSVVQAAATAPEWGLSWPWEWMTDATRGIRKGETYYIGAGVKMGKSELVNSLGVHLMLEHGQTVFFVKPEEAKVKTMKMLASKVEGHFFHDPKREFDKEAYYRTAEKIADKALILDVYQNLDWQVLRKDIVDAVRMGAESVFIDPITNLTNGIGSGEANVKLQEIAQDLSAMAKDYNFSAFIFCHLKSPDSGASHERGGKVLSHQFAGSRAMMRSCNYMFGLEGNKDPDLEAEDRNIRRLVILEDREFGESGACNLYWDQNTGLFGELKEYG